MRQREALDYADDLSFAGVIRQVSPASDLAGHRCEVHDDAAFLCDHRWQRGLTGEEDCLGVDVHHRIPVFLSDIERLRRAIDATIDFGAMSPFTFVPAYTLPVYASQWPLPDTTQDSRSNGRSQSCVS